MKNILKLSLLLFLSIFAACNSDYDVVSTVQQPSGDVLKLVVSATDFVTDGAPDTRATDSEKKIIFENDDRVGVIILDGCSNILANNVPYKYNNGAWSFDSSNNEGKDQCYYYNKATTYIVYYPYNQAANNIKTKDDLKNKFKPQADQSTKEAYRASDLMVWSYTSGTPLKSLNVILTHAYASVSFFSKETYLLDDGKGTVVWDNISDVNLTIDNDIYIPYQAPDGSSRYILPDGFAGKVRCFYTVGGKKCYSNTIDVSSGVIANTRYTFGTMITATYTLADAKVGDFYCKRSDNGNGYLIPGDVALTADQQTACVGVVFWVGDATKKDKTLKSDHSDCTHGLVVALNDASNGTAWQSFRGSIGGWLDNYRPKYLPIWSTVGRNSVTLNNIQGYNNTEAIEEYIANKDNGKFVQAISTVVAYRSEVLAPANSSDWYLPSAKELSLLCGLDVNDIYYYECGKGNRGLINGKLLSISNVAAEISWSKYWSSTETGAGNAFYLDFEKGFCHYSQKEEAYKVRCVLAF